MKSTDDVAPSPGIGGIETYAPDRPISAMGPDGVVPAQIVDDRLILGVAAYPDHAAHLKDVATRRTPATPTKRPNIAVMFAELRAVGLGPVQMSAPAVATALDIRRTSAHGVLPRGGTGPVAVVTGLPSTLGDGASLARRGVEKPPAVAGIRLSSVRPSGIGLQTPATANSMDAAQTTGRHNTPVQWRLRIPLPTVLTPAAEAPTR